MVYCISSCIKDKFGGCSIFTFSLEKGSVPAFCITGCIQPCTLLQFNFHLPSQHRSFVVNNSITHVSYVSSIAMSSSRVYSDMKLDLPWMLYQGRKYAFKKVQRMDPSSIQRGVRQFKTYMSIKLDQVSIYVKLYMLLFSLLHCT